MFTENSPFGRCAWYPTLATMVASYLSVFEEGSIALKQALGVLAAMVLATVGVLLSSTVGPFASTAAGASAAVAGELKKWYPITLSFAGPNSSETSTSPNPFLDRRLQVTFIAPSGKTYTVPGFFDGDGNGGATGNVWRAHFSPMRLAPGATRLPSAGGRTSPSI
jgi:Domain of unknown function (DUF5060)